MRLTQQNLYPSFADMKTSEEATKKKLKYPTTKKLKQSQSQSSSSERQNIANSKNKKDAN